MKIQYPKLVRNILDSYPELNAPGGDELAQFEQTLLSMKKLKKSELKQLKEILYFMLATALLAEAEKKLDDRQVLLFLIDQIKRILED